MYRSAIRAWEIGMQAFPIKSRQYGSICGTGRRVRETYFLIMGEAEARKWRGDKLREVSDVDIYCNFS